MHVNPGREWGMGREGVGQPGTDRPGAALLGSRMLTQVQLLVYGRSDREGIGLCHHSQGGSCIRG